MIRTPSAVRSAQQCLVAACLSVAACGADANTKTDAAATASGARVDLTGAGATFPFPLYSRWFNDYAQQTNVRINYQSIGSGGGIRQVLASTVDFGATDVPMTATELSQTRLKIIHVPTVLGAVAITYNLPELQRPLRLSGVVIADIFLGRITRWNDPRIAESNPDVPLPDRDILVVHRSDGSGTSYIMSDYLAAVSPAWAAGPGRGKDVRWPIGIAGKGNEGVAGQVKQLEGSLGYLEVVYARQNRLPIAHIRNRAGRYISPMPFEIASAAASSSAPSSGEGGDVPASLVDAPGDQAYPIASFTLMLIAPEAIGPAKTRQLVAFLHWALTEGGVAASALGYVALPSQTASRVLDQLDSALARISAGREPAAAHGVSVDTAGRHRLAPRGADH